MKLVLPLIAAVLLAGCSLNPGETRRITAWGLWAEAYGVVVGIGYWQSERGPNVKDQPADKPTDALKALPTVKGPPGTF